MEIGIFHLAGIFLVLLLITGVSLYSGRNVKDAADFTTGGGRVGRWMVCGTIMGSLVGGQATVGTAQMAFNYGLSAWWFTLGSGIGCLLLGLFYALRLRSSRSATLIGNINREYGALAGCLGSLLSATGIFISVVAQVVSSVALVTSIFPVEPLPAALISIVLMAFYVVFGGVWGAGMGGVVKLILLYVASLSGCIIVLLHTGGIATISQALSGLLVDTDLGRLQGILTEGDIPNRFFSLVARGPMKDISSGLSLLLGVLSTQIYAQATVSARSDREARRGSFLAACLIPPIGVACILIGLFMRQNYITTAELQALQAAGAVIPDGLREIGTAAQAFPLFVINHMPPLFGGVILGTLFITIVGGGAGLSLGTATVLVNDLFKRVSRRLREVPTIQLAVTRLTILCVLLVASAVALLASGTMINDMGFLSMGLRGAVVFVPLTCALYFPGKVDGRLVVAGELGGLLGVLGGQFLSLPVDPLFVGVAVSLLFCMLGVLVKRRGTPAGRC